MNLRQDAENILQSSIAAVLPDEAVKRSLRNTEFSGRLLLVSVGKAGWTMAKAALDCLGDRIEKGVVVTKYGHAMEELPRCQIFEAGHPVPDENSFRGAKAAIALVKDAGEGDTVLFLLSGGGSSLFELPLIPPEELQDVTRQLLASGADIVEMNTLRKRLSAVKGGRFALYCAPARVHAIVLSDILGDPLDMIASGPCYPDSSTSEEALSVVQKYGLKLSFEALSLLEGETPKSLSNVHTEITGSVRELCRAAEAEASALGYHCQILTDELCCTARDAGSFLASIARSHQNSPVPLCFIAGGETVVRLTGKGLGGRNQELALAAAEGIAGLPAAAVFSFGSDGTDGPTDAAGGYVDGKSRDALLEKGYSIHAVLAENNSYPALDSIGGLLRTGPTGTNVNDAALVLLRPALSFQNRK